MKTLKLLEYSQFFAGKTANIKKNNLTLLELIRSAQRKRQWISLALLSFCSLMIIPGCTHYNAYWNKPRQAVVTPVSFARDALFKIIDNRENQDVAFTARHASFQIADDRGNQDVLLMLALSGGGSRAAYFSARVMTTLQHDIDLDILKEVDVISSVSGGSLAGAYYAVTKDPEFVIPIPRCKLDCEVFAGQPGITCQKTGKKQQLVIAILDDEEKKTAKTALRKVTSGCSIKERAYIDWLFNLSQARVSSNRIWVSKEQWLEQRKKDALNLHLGFERYPVEDIMSRDFLNRWLLNWFIPTNIARYWFTAYDRSDIMAQTFEDNLFDTKNLGFALKFSNLNPERPYLIINATDGTEPYQAKKKGTKTRSRNMHFGSVFTFTDEDFTEQLNSDIYQYDVARAVMASAAFPAVFSYMTLKDFTDENDERYHHVFDGGNADNLGLRSLSRVLKSNYNRYKHIIVILVDAFVEPVGKSSTDPESRSTFSHYLDMNFMDSFDALLKSNRQIGINEFLKDNIAIQDKLTFWHITFDKIDENIPDITSLSNDDKKPESITPVDKNMPDAKQLSGNDERQESKKLVEGLNRIETTLNISDENIARIEEAVRIIFKKDAPCLERIKKILLNENPAPPGPEAKTPACR